MAKMEHQDGAGAALQPRSGDLEIMVGPARLRLRPSGAIWMPADRLLAVSDLHLGRSERVARRGGPLLPPYETQDALSRLGAEIAALDPATVLCLGDSFDDPSAAEALAQSDRATLETIAAGRDWIWISGNHDPEPPLAPGAAVAEARIGGLVFRHIAAPALSAPGEASGHYHPKAVLRLRGKRIARRCFLADAERIIAPAFGAFTGGLEISDPVFDPLFPRGATAYLLAGRMVAPAPRSAAL